MASPAIPDNAPAILLACGLFKTPNAKTSHGLLRRSDRFRIVAVVDEKTAGNDAGEILDGRKRDVPIVASTTDALALSPRPAYCIVGVATHGGVIPPSLRSELLAAIEAGLHVVNGLHHCLADDPVYAEAASRREVHLIDIRRPKPKSELHFWTGAIRDLAIPRVAVLGIDCAIGKRTTARLLESGLREAGVKAEMIFTGQTGWMQGGRFGFIFDSTPNDFVCGELEHAILRCAAEASPAVILLEGQSSLQNPSGPCGAEFLLAGGASAVVLQIAPNREYFEGFESLGLRLPSVESEIALIRSYGARVLAVTLNTKGMDESAIARSKSELAGLSIPVLDPLRELPALVDAVLRGV